MVSEVVERKEFKAVADATLSDFFTRTPRDADSYCLRMTSGTTDGLPLFLVWDNRFTAHGLFAGADRVLMCTGSLAARLGNALLLRNGMGAEKARVLCADIQDMMPEFSALMDDFKPTELYGFSSFVRRAAAFCSPETGARVRALLFASEPVSPALQNVFESVFPNALLKLVYHTNETGALSRPPCGHLPLDSYHVLDGVDVAIDDPDETGAGDILVSKRISPNIVVEKYRIGDIGRIHHDPCPCGETSSLQLLGRRGYDYIRIAGTTLLQKEFERAAEALNDLFDDYRAEASSQVTDSAVVGAIVLRVHRKDGMWSEALAREIARRFSAELFLTQTKTLDDLVRAGAFSPLVVERASEPFQVKLKELKLTQRKD